jgi:hypothetical protein
MSDRFNTGLAVWMVALSAIIPSLDRELLDSETTIASGHHDECAHPHHNHTLCVQFGKQRWAKGSSIPLRVLPPSRYEAVSVLTDAPAEFRYGLPTHSRAPPRSI